MSAVLTNRLELAAQIVAGAEFGWCGLRHGHGRIFVRLKFVLRLRRGILDRCLLGYWRFLW